MTYHLTDGIEFMKSLPDKSVDGIFTDPPWGVGPAIIGNDCAVEGLRGLCRETNRVLKDGMPLLIYWGMMELDTLFSGCPAVDYKGMLFLHRIPAPFGFQCQIRLCLEPIAIFTKWGDSLKKVSKSKRQVYTHIVHGPKDSLHPCARPFNTIKEVLSDWFNIDEYVIDPFAGSDTTGVACRELNLKYDTCEIDPVMYETGLHRHKQQGLFENDTSGSRPLEMELGSRTQALRPPEDKRRDGNVLDGTGSVGVTSNPDSPSQGQRMPRSWSP